MSDNEELSEFMQEYGDDYSTTITLTQMQHLINEKVAARARIQELEAQVERLRKAALGVVADCEEAVLDDESCYCVNHDVISGLECVINETPAQSLEAVKLEVKADCVASMIHEAENAIDNGFGSEQWEFAFHMSEIWNMDGDDL